MAGPFNHHLHIVLPRDLREFPKRFQLAQLRRIIGVINRAGAQAIAQRKRDIIGLHNLANLFEIGIEKAFLVMRQAPFRHNRAAARNNAGHALRRQRHIFQQHTGVNGEIINALFGLFNQRVAKHFPSQFLCLAIDFFQRLINRHCADGHRRIA